MKPEELMLGDIVLASGKPIHVTLATLSCKVDVKPMPLIEETLINNGFKKVDAIIYSTPRVGVNYEYRVTQEGLRVLVNNSCVGAPTCTSIKTCKYVHEVQHMIRDCDITREIIV